MFVMFLIDSPIPRIFKISLKCSRKTFLYLIFKYMWDVEIEFIIINNDYSTNNQSELFIRQFW